MSAVVTTVIAALSAFAALASLFLYLYFGRRSDLAAAREEALALAETRRQVFVSCGDAWSRSRGGTSARRQTVNGESVSCSPRSTKHGRRRATRRIARSTSTPMRSLTS